jgi:hypothetical protein
MRARALFIEAGFEHNDSIYSSQYTIIIKGSGI